MAVGHPSPASPFFRGIKRLRNFLTTPLAPSATFKPRGVAQHYYMNYDQRLICKVKAMILKAFKNEAGATCVLHRAQIGTV